MTAPGELTGLRGVVTRRFFAFSLFWRTFVLLSLLLGGGIFAWVQTLRALEFEPRAVQAAQQIANLVKVSRAALRYTDQLNRVTLVKTMADQESVILRPREPNDKFKPYEVDRFTRWVASELRARLGPKTEVASFVNGKPGLWVGFQIENDQYWLHTDQSRVGLMAAGSTYFGLDRHRPHRHGAGLGRHCRADQPAVAAVVVCCQPHPRGRIRLAAR